MTSIPTRFTMTENAKTLVDAGFEPPFSHRPNVEIPELFTVVDGKGLPVTTTHLKGVADMLVHDFNFTFECSTENNDGEC